jgi:hypothetical protein
MVLAQSAPALFPGLDLVTIKITLISGAIATVIGAAGAAIVTVIRALAEIKLQQAATAARQIENAAVITSVAKDTEAIKGHVNSEKTASDGREAALRAENDMLRQIIAEKKATADLLAQAAAQVLGVPAPVIPPKP